MSLKPSRVGYYNTLRNFERPNSYIPHNALNKECESARTVTSIGQGVAEPKTLAGMVHLPWTPTTDCVCDDKRYPVSSRTPLIRRTATTVSSPKYHVNYKQYLNSRGKAPDQTTYSEVEGVDYSKPFAYTDTFRGPQLMNKIAAADDDACRFATVKIRNKPFHKNTSVSSSAQIHRLQYDPTYMLKKQKYKSNSSCDTANCRCSYRSSGRIRFLL